MIGVYWHDGFNLFQNTHTSRISICDLFADSVVETPAKKARLTSADNEENISSSVTLHQMRQAQTRSSTVTEGNIIFF